MKSLKCWWCYLFKYSHTKLWHNIHVTNGGIAALRLKKKSTGSLVRQSVNIKLFDWQMDWRIGQKTDRQTRFSSFFCFLMVYNVVMVSGNIKCCRVYLFQKYLLKNVLFFFFCTVVASTFFNQAVRLIITSHLQVRIITDWYAFKFWQIAQQADCALNFIPQKNSSCLKSLKISTYHTCQLASVLSLCHVGKFCNLAKVWLFARFVLYIESIHLFIYLQYSS